jgi:hypothetical protein
LFGFSRETLVQQRANFIKLTKQRLIGRLGTRADSHARIGKIDYTSLIKGLLIVTAWGPVTHTFIHLVPIKDQLSRLFNAFCLMGGNRFKSAF